MTTPSNNKQHFTNHRLGGKRDQLKLTDEMLARVTRMQQAEMTKQLSPIPKAWVFRKLIALGLDVWEREQGISQ